MGDSKAEKSVRKIIDHSAFTFEGKRYEIIQNAKPGETKTDYYILAYDYDNSIEREFKISYKKDANLKMKNQKGYSFVENKVKPHRIPYIYGENWSEILKKQIARVNTTEENERIKKKVDESLVDSFNRSTIIDFKKEKIMLGWRYEIEALDAPAITRRDVCAMIEQDISSKVFWGEGCSDEMRDSPLTIYDPFTMEPCKGKIKEESGIREFILVRHPSHIHNVDDVFNNVQDIRKYAEEHWETRASFIGQNNIWLSSKNIWKTDSPARSFAVWIKWEVIGKSKKLRGRPVFDQPLERVAEKVIKNLSECFDKMEIPYEPNFNFKMLKGRITDDTPVKQ